MQYYRGTKTILISLPVYGSISLILDLKAVELVWLELVLLGLQVLDRVEDDVNGAGQCSAILTTTLRENHVACS